MYLCDAWKKSEGGKRREKKRREGKLDDKKGNWSGNFSEGRTREICENNHVYSTLVHNLISIFLWMLVQWTTEMFLFLM